MRFTIDWNRVASRGVFIREPVCCFFKGAVELFSPQSRTFISACYMDVLFVSFLSLFFSHKRND